MKLLTPTQHKRLNEATGVVLLLLGIIIWLAVISYRSTDPSWNTAVGAARPQNLIGYFGSYLADVLLQTCGIAAYFLPVLMCLVAWKWLRSEPVEAPVAKTFGTLLLMLSLSAALALGPKWGLYEGAIEPGGMVGLVLADNLRRAFNITGAVLVDAIGLTISIYLLSTFSLLKFIDWAVRPLSALDSAMTRVGRAMARWRPGQRKSVEAAAPPRSRGSRRLIPEEDAQPGLFEESDLPPVRDLSAPAPPPEPIDLDEIPIRPLVDDTPPWEAASEEITERPAEAPVQSRRTEYFRPSTSLLNEPQGRSPYDEQELQEIAQRVKAKFEEFNVFGSVVQINPGPVVTTFEFKPDAGIKYSKITTLTEDLCLGLQAESILIERIPGKPTVGIEVPNRNREVISLRQMLESEEFRNSKSRLTISLGKDINGRIKVASLETMPHLLIAGSTGAGKSVMINAMIMSILYKSTPDEVRLIMVDPKQLELGLYEGIPHLLTPVIKEPKKATNALKNAVLEMERRLRVLAEQGVRNIDQYNEKMTRLREASEEAGEEVPDELRNLPYILILIDELSDLMILEGRNVEESVTRLAQMARAVGMHLVLATQRPSVDVITGLIKANFPARLSFRVATRVDSRTILDQMGAEHLLGKGDMLFLPPGSGRLTRVHGAFVSENEINRVVTFWKDQGEPVYDETYLAAPPADDEAGESEDLGEQDPMYEEAVRLVLEVGKASTSTLQRRLRLGYGRAARILDMMQRDGLIGPPDGSKPREVLKRPDWLHEVEDTLR